MGPRFCTLLYTLLCTLSLAALPAAAGGREKPFSTPHIHSLDAGASHVLRDALNKSATVGRLVARIERSDVIVLLAVKQPEDGLVGKTQMITAAPGARYVMVTVDPRAIPIDVVGRLAHEFQHVVEIADAPEVTDQDGVSALFRRIGWQRGYAPNWETQAAIDTGRRATREAGERPAHVGDLAQYGRPAAEHR